MTDVVLEVRGLRKAFDPGLFQPQVEVLKGIDLEVVRGEIFGLLGPNGAGKTTTLKAILDLVRPDAGVVRICGHPHDSREARRRVGFMPENPSLYPHLTGDEYLGFCARLLDIPDTEAPARIREVLSLRRRHLSRPALLRATDRSAWMNAISAAPKAVPTSTTADAACSLGRPTPKSTSSRGLGCVSPGPVSRTAVPPSS